MVSPRSFTKFWWALGTGSSSLILFFAVCFTGECLGVGATSATNTPCCGIAAKFEIDDQSRSTGCGFQLAKVP